MVPVPDSYMIVLVETTMVVVSAQVFQVCRFPPLVKSPRYQQLAFSQQPDGDSSTEGICNISVAQHSTHQQDSNMYSTVHVTLYMSCYARTTYIEHSYMHVGMYGTYMACAYMYIYISEHLTTCPENGRKPQAHTR